MTNSISSALNAYQQALVRIGSQIPAEEAAKASSTPSDFQSMVTNALNSAVDLNKNAEAVTMQGIAGKADIQDVVLAGFPMPRWHWKRLWRFAIRRLRLIRKSCR